MDAPVPPGRHRGARRCARTRGNADYLLPVRVCRLCPTALYCTGASGRRNPRDALPHVPQQTPLRPMIMRLPIREIVAAALCWPLLAQLPESSLISIQVKRVVLHATVRESKGAFVGDLQKEDFEVLEDGVRQEIVSFSREDLPVATAILVDNSRSMLNKSGEVVAAAKSFVRAS